ncbi:acetyltransferase [Legionella sp. W05-934-2]|jgi:hypothetical protein|uniref:acetyltransferase n=1 Tax=Legionella sp. W05-934-2 TaxID=1198649 RepID=UPI003462E95C
MAFLRTASQCFVFLFILLSNPLYSAPNTGGTNSDMKGVCELAGGTFTSTVEGTWACCWDNWGCYGCIQSVCKMKCHTQRCRRANGQSSILQPGEIRIKKTFGQDIVVPRVSTNPAPDKPKPLKQDSSTSKQMQ